MARHRTVYSPFFPQEDCPGEQIEACGRLLALRVLARSGPRTITRIREAQSAGLAAVLEEDGCPDPADVPQRAAVHLKQLEQLGEVTLRPLHRNLELLSGAVTLSVTDKDLITLHIVGKHFQPLYDILDAHGDLISSIGNRFTLPAQG